MIQIRKGVFETNQSSTHTVAIDLKEIDRDAIPKKIVFTPGEYGWEFKEVQAGNYLWTAVLVNYNLNNRIADCDYKVEDKKNNIMSIIKIFGQAFKEYGIETEWILEPITSTYIQTWSTNPSLVVNDYACGDCGIDHAHDLKHLIDEMIENPDLFVKATLGTRSTVILGNDNESMENVKPRLAEKRDRLVSEGEDPMGTIKIYEKGN